MKVKKATEKDHADIVAFQLAMAYETEKVELNKKIVEEGVMAVLSDSNRGCYYVAEFDGKTVGSLLITFEWSDWRNGTILWIQSVYVRKEYRRQGVYSGIYSYIRDKVQKDDSLNGIRLYADKSNFVAQETYKNLGMNKDHYVMFEWMKE